MVRQLVALTVILALGGQRGRALTASPAAARSCATQEVEGRSGHAMAYDADAGRVVMFGGGTDDPADPWPRSLWAWDGERWRCLSADGPPGRRDGELAYDATRKRLVLYGGRVFGPNRQLRLMTDSWEWDGRRWTLVDSIGPPARTHMGVAYDGPRRAVLLHGGVGERSWRLDGFTDTWAWDGARWRQLALGPRPAGITNALLGTPRGGGVLLVMALDDSAAECRGLQRAALFELRGDAWSRLTTRTPGPCFSPQGAAVATPDGAMLYAGWDPGPASAAAWLWRPGAGPGAPGAWARTDSAPPRRRSARMAWDAGRRRVVLFGGDTNEGVLADTWEWDGRRWTRADRR